MNIPIPPELLASGRADLATCTGFDADGRPLIAVGDEAPAAAPILGQVSRQDLDEAVATGALLLVLRVRERPVVLGVLRDIPLHDPVRGTADGERLELTAGKDLVLRCGSADIHLNRTGKVLIRGEYVLTRAAGLNKIKGGSVQIN